jgi:hypothetical protein
MSRQKRILEAPFLDTPLPRRSRGSLSSVRPVFQTTQGLVLENWRRRSNILLLSVFFAAAGIPRLSNNFVRVGSLDEAEHLKYEVMLCALGTLVACNMHILKRLTVSSLDPLWSFFSVCVIVSGAYNQDLYAVGLGTWCLTGVQLVYFFLIPAVVLETGKYALELALIAGSVPYLLASLLLIPIGAGLYQGITVHPNNIGHFSIVLAIASLSFLVGGERGRRTSARTLIGGAVLSGCLFLILMCGSRTSLTTFGGLVVVAAWIHTKRIGLAGLRSLFLFGCAMIAVAVGTSVLSGVDIGALVERLQSKQYQVTQSGDVLSGRSEMWQDAWNNLNVLGNGSLFFTDRYGLTAHNSFINVLGMYGLVAFAAFLLYVLLSAFQTVSSAAYRKGSPLAALASFGFLMMSLGEGMWSGIGNALSIVYFVGWGVHKLRTPRVRRRVSGTSRIPWLRRQGRQHNECVPG